MAFKINTKEALKKAKKVSEKKEVKISGDIESECLEEVNEVINEFSAKAKAETDRFKQNTDANYFTVLTFNNSEQLDEFLNKVGLTPSDKQYIDGIALCKKIGIDITTKSLKTPSSFKVNKRLTNMIL